MANYKVEFNPEWLRGRWGFTDRVMTQLGGQAADRSKINNAWVLSYQGKPRDLGRLLTELLELQQFDFLQLGVLFDIHSLDPPSEDPPRKETKLTLSKAQERQREKDEILERKRSKR
ncbi:MAG: hypothetical protein OEV94_07660 [Deltaproteobacteria bacterium]|nr:hypothetical protein [Deltaproteobacteria bacterium]